MAKRQGVRKSQGIVQHPGASKFRKPLSPVGLQIVIGRSHYWKPEKERAVCTEPLTRAGTCSRSLQPAHGDTARRSQDNKRLDHTVLHSSDLSAMFLTG